MELLAQVVPSPILYKLTKDKQKFWFEFYNFTMRLSAYFLASVLSLNNCKIYNTKAVKNISIQEKNYFPLIFNLGFASTHLRTTQPCLQQVNLTWALDLIKNQHLVSGPLQKKNVTSLKSSKLEPTIWSCDTGKQILCFDRCQLTITWYPVLKRDDINQGCMYLLTY